MFTKYFKSRSWTNPVLAITAVSASLRFIGIFHWIPFFGDQAWFLDSAVHALMSGTLPLLGITSSITWLHQGPFWTYIIIPGLGLTRFSFLSLGLFTAALSVFEVPLAYLLGSRLKNRRTGLIFAVIMGGYYFSVIHSRLAYHTSLIPLFFILFLNLLLSRHDFLSGLFLGFLYQLHLLTFIYWPFVIFHSRRTSKFHLSQFVIGFIIGILPFIISGPVQTSGIFVWLISRLFSGFGSVGFISEAYLVVFLAPAALAVSYIFPPLPRKAFGALIVVFFLVNFWYLIKTDYQTSVSKFGLPFPIKQQIAKDILVNSATFAPRISTSGPGSQFATTVLPYKYLLWRLIDSGQTPSGTASGFIVNEQNGRLTVLE